MNWKGCGMSQLCPYCVIPVFSWSNKWKPQKLRIPRVLAKIHTRYIANKNLQVLYAYLFGVDIIGLLCYQGYHTTYDRGYLKNDLPFIYTVHSIITYGMIFWGNSPHSTHVFKIQKRIIWIMTKSRRRDSCRLLFERLQILPLQSQYIINEWDLVF
jgi:hypothetical protein